MRRLVTTIVVGVFMAAAAQPAGAGPSIAERDAYTQKARDDIRTWQRRLHEAGLQAAAAGTGAGAATGTELSVAWTRSSAASRRLQLIGAEGWEGAKTTFETAHRELAEAWRKHHPEDRATGDRR